MGGAVLARALGEQGIRTVVLERGTRLPRSPQNWSRQHVVVDDAYKNAGAWHDASGGTFKPGVHYWVGGNTKGHGYSPPRDA